MIVVSLTVNAWAVAMLAGTHDWKACVRLGPWGGALYTIMHLFCYRVLVVRAESVQSIMPMWYRHVLQFVRLGMYSCFIMSVLTFLVFSSKVYFAEKICMVQVNGFLPATLAVVDTMLSATLLGLFVLPVLKQRGAPIATPQTATSTGNIRREESSMLTRRVARQNLLFSSIPIVSTVTYLSVVAKLNTTETHEDPSLQHLNLIPMLGGGIDALINMLAIFAMFRKVLFPGRHRPK